MTGLLDDAFCADPDGHLRDADPVRLISDTDRLSD